MKIKLLSLFLVLLFAVSCKDDISPMLALHVPQQEDNSIVLNWKPSGISGFQYYAVMRASDGQNYQIINDIANPASDAFWKEITTFTDNTYPLEADILYYKIMAVGNETAVSENVLFRNKNKAQLITGNNIRDMFFIEETNQISIVDYANDNYYGYQLRVFDLQSGQFLPNTTPIHLNSSGCWYLWGKYNGKTEFYNYDSNYTMYVYDAATARQAAQLNAPSYVWYEPFVANNKGQIYIFDTYRLSIIDRATNTSSMYNTDTNVYPDFLYYNAVENKIYAIGNGYLILTLDEQGKVLTEERRSFPANIYPMEIFIENSSMIFARSEDGIKILDLNDGTYHSAVFTDASYYSSPKAILVNNNIYVANGTNQIYKLSTTDYSVIQKINTRAIPSNMFVANGHLYYLGQYSNNTYLLDKIKL